MTGKNMKAEEDAEMAEMEEVRVVRTFMKQAWTEMNCHTRKVPYEIYIDIAGFEIKTIHEEDEELVLQFLRHNYYNGEPWKVVKDDEATLRQDVSYHMSLIYEGMSLVALQPAWVRGRLIKRVVGVVITRPKGPDEPQKLFQEAEQCGKTQWGETLLFLGCVERDADVFRRYNVEKALHVHVLAIAEEWRELDVGERLLRALRHLCRKLKIGLITLDSTFLYVQRICQKFEMDCVHEVCYCDYKNKKGKNVFLSPRPNELARTYALKIVGKKSNRSSRHQGKQHFLKYKESITSLLNEPHHQRRQSYEQEPEFPNEMLGFLGKDNGYAPKKILKKRN